VIVLSDGGLTVERGVLPAGFVYLDGSGIGDVEEVLRDRRHLADDGVLIVTVGFVVATGEIVFGPDVDSHGVSDDTDDIHAAVRDGVVRGLEGLEVPTDLDTVRRKVRTAAGRAVKKAVNRRPVVFPVLIEV
jgi:ribonuclease J